MCAHALFGKQAIAIRLLSRDRPDAMGVTAASAPVFDQVAQQIQQHAASEGLAHH